MKVWRVPHPSVYIIEEIEERHWDRDILAYMMVCGLTNTREALKWFTERPREEWEQEWQKARLAIDMYFAVGPTDPRLRMGEIALQFAKAFGTSDEFFSNLETAWLRDQGATSEVIP